MFDVVLQGPIYPYTKEVIGQYLEQDWVRDIIISTWEGEDTSNLMPEGLGFSQGHLTIIKSEDVAHPGVGNRNRQIVSSKAGVRILNPGDFAIKGRTDQIIKDLPMMKRYFDKFYEKEVLFTLGMYRNFPFHPRDHLFMGKVQNLYELFDCPLDTYEVPEGQREDYNICLRAETWIGQFYYAVFNDEVQKMIDSPTEYLTDRAPKRNEALALDYTMRNDLFKVFPRIDMSWPKITEAQQKVHGQTSETYHYGYAASIGEYWYDGVWE